jgi:hypothetical protein
MKTSIVNYNGLESQSKRACKLQTPHPALKTTTEAPSFMTMDHSEPECEVHPNEEACDKCSNLQRSYPSPKMQQRSSAQWIQKSLTDSPKGHLFQEQCNNVATCENRESIMPSKNENEEKMMDLNASFTEEYKTKKLNGTGDEDGDQLPRQASKDYSSVVSDDFSSTKEFEDEKDLFSIPIFDTTLWTEDDMSFCLDLEGTDSEIQVAVNEIRKEAEKIDAILILDQFKTLQTEFDSARKKISLKTMENEDLKIQLEESKNKVAHMELERDLHHADATKLREDLKTVVSKMFDISMYESSYESVNEKKRGMQEIMDSDQHKKSLSRVHRPNNTSHNNTYSAAIHAKNPALNEDERSTTSLTREKMCIIGLIDQPRHVVRRLPLFSDPGLIRMRSHGQFSHFSDANTIHLPPSSRQNQPLRNQNVFRERSCHIARRPRTESVRVERKDIVEIPLDSRGKDFKRTIIHHYKSLSAIDTKTTSLISETKDEVKETENRRCGMLFRRRSKQQSFSREDVSLLKQQISQLHEMMKTSLAASEKLRNRLKVISRYYEGVISKLQTKVAEVKAEKSRTQVDLTNMVSQVDLERRLEKSKFEDELHRKDEEIAILKAGGDQGEV